MCVHMVHVICTDNMASVQRVHEPLTQTFGLLHQIPARQSYCICIQACAFVERHAMARYLCLPSTLVQHV